MELRAPSAHACRNSNTLVNVHAYVATRARQNAINDIFPTSNIRAHKYNANKTRLIRDKGDNDTNK